jgi:SAM-dependent methyltransferase
MMLRPYISPFDRLIQYVPEDSRVLDVGCGAGLFLGLLAATGRRLHGVGFDSSASAILAADSMGRQTTALGSEAVLNFVHLDVRSPWPVGPFNIVSIIDVMHHIPASDRRSVIQRACAALRPGGLLLYKDIGARPRWRAAANRIHDLLMTREWIGYTPLSEVESWAREEGLKRLETERINRLWYGHDLMLCRLMR